MEVTKDWPIWAIILYLFIKDGVPSIGLTLTRIFRVVVPAKVKEKELEALQAREVEEKRDDMREREVVALEQIGKSLIIMDLRVQNLDKKVDTLTVGIINANNALVIILDRMSQRREDFAHKSQDNVDDKPM